MKWIAAQTNGKFINLNSLSKSALERELTYETSLIVLETLQDYMTYNIVPPAELQADYFRWKKGQDEERIRRQKDFLNAAVGATKELQKWWNTDFNAPKNKYPKPDNKTSVAFTPPVLARERNVRDEEVIVSQQELTETKAEISVADVKGSETGKVVDIVDLQEHKVVVEESRKVSLTGAAKNSKPQIQITPIKQDKDYLKNLTGKAEADYALYLKLRPDYIGTPDFYFDMADWFYRLKDSEKALRILTCIADIDLENASLFRLLGYRLKEYKAYPLEAYICQKVIQWRPFEPQSYRDYALALADNGKYQAALDSLYSVLTQSYATNINARSAGIEEVVVTEINHLIAQNSSLNSSVIDKNILKAMPVDIRVVINWNMNNTDIDLHVKDPRGETCFYGNKATAIGGRISTDNTQGYGPEQFMLKKALQGKYEVFVNYFGDSQVKREGPSTVMVEIYTSYSGKEEQRQVVCVQLSKEKKAVENGLLKIAEFKF